jgi:hypothetical protein
MLGLALLLLLSPGRQSSAQSDALGVLLIIAAEFVVVRLIQAEAIPGQNQFWITRPYRWQSLLMAKMLFLVAFLLLPVFLTQMTILLLRGFRFGEIVPGLLWSQVLFLVCVALPFSLLASLTDSIAAFLVCTLSIALLVVGGMWLNPWVRILTPGRMDWLRLTILVGTLAVIGPPLLYLQYRTRRTHQIAAAAAMGALLGAILYTEVGWTTLFPLQAALSKVRPDVQIHLTGAARTWTSQDNRINVDLPFTVTGLSEDLLLEFEAFEVVALVNGRTVRLPNTRLVDQRVESHESDLPGRTPQRNWRLMAVSNGAVNTSPTALHASLYLTLFGNAREQTIRLSKHPAGILGLQCFAGFMNQLTCEAPFRWPGRILSQKNGEARSTITRLISYSPFPATLDTDPIITQGIAYYPRDPLPAERLVTLESLEPVAYLRRDLEVRDILPGRARP